MKILIKFVFTVLAFNFISVAMAAGSLTQEDAEWRAYWIGDVKYVLNLQLDPSQKEFLGNLQIEFVKKAGELNKDLWLDHNEGTVRKISINGKETDVKQSDGRVFLPKDLLVDGTNQIKIEYVQNFSSNGEGLHKYKDPVDSEYYIYTQFEPFSANKMLPLFDQPDLKASISLMVDCPKNWQVISTTLPRQKKDVGKWQRWEFFPTAKISSYLYSLHAGPYHIWSDKHNDIPLRLFARKSMVKLVDAGFWFKITKQGLRYFGEYFGVKYPFGKYDQLIVPEFNAGAMENVAAVTFSERYLKSGKPTRKEKQRMADVILHEMAHMWFGNLVTMRWWNDLWLNESFATFMSTMALANATEFKEAWEEFFGTKSWAMWEDQQPTTHPIDGVIKSTEDAWASFDGITYGKGASVMKQLRHLVGDKAFQAGLKQYFKKHAYGNTIRKDFTDAIGTAANISLGEWSSTWLEDAGLDRVTTLVGCEDGRLNNVIFRIDNPISKKSREHAITLALIESEKNKIKIYKKVPLKISGQEFKWEPQEKLKCPDLLFSNYDDNGYLKITFDKKSVETLKEQISDIPDSLLRLQSWHALWEMVREGSLSVRDYSDFALKHIGKEKNDRVFESIAAALTGSGYAERNSIPFYWRGGAGRDEYQRRVEEFFYKKLISAGAGSDYQKYYFDYYVSAARTTEARRNLQGYLSGSLRIGGFVFDQDRRWKVVKRLCAVGVSNCEALIKKEIKNDNSDRSQNNALGARAAQPIAAIKEEMYKKIIQLPADISFNRQRSILNNMFTFEQESLSKEFTERFFDFFRGDYEKYSENLRDEFAESLLPLYCEDEPARRLASFLDKNKNLPTSVQKSLRIGLAEDARCRMAVVK